MAQTALTAAAAAWSSAVFTGTIHISTARIINNKLRVCCEDTFSNPRTFDGPVCTLTVQLLMLYLYGDARVRK